MEYYWASELATHATEINLNRRSPQLRAFQTPGIRFHATPFAFKLNVLTPFFKHGRKCLAKNFVGQLTAKAKGVFD